MSDQETPSMSNAVAEAVAPAEEAIQGQNEQSDESSQESTGTQEVAAEAVATLKDPKASKAEKKAAQKQLKKLKIQVDGEEDEIEYDPNDEDFMRKQVQLARMGQKRAQEKALIEKEVLQFIEDLRKNPRKALSDPAIGMDLKAFAAQIIEEEIENSKKSPEQLEKEKLEAELRALKEERENEKKTAQEKEFERLKEQEYERYDVLMSQALEKSDLPKSPAVVKKIADYMLLGLQANKDITPADVLPIVREEIINDYKELLNSLPDEEIEKFIGKERINSIRKKNIAKAKQAASNPALKAPTKTTDTGKAKEEAKEEKKISMKDFFKF